jgi:hypothetical protein
MTRGRHAALVTCSTLGIIGLAASIATATVFKIDEFSLDLNGQQIFLDTFSDGLAPPSGPQFLVGPAASTIYNTLGTFSEAGGKAVLDPVVNGAANTNVQNLPDKDVRALLLTPTDPSLGRSLNATDTFKVSAVYDLTLPTIKTEDYRILLTDRSSNNAASLNSPDSLDLRVERRLSDNQVMVRFVRVNFATDQNEVVAQIAVDLSGNPDQIRLNLAKLDPTTNQITASFSYLKNGQVIGGQTFGPTAAIFSQQTYTRATFLAQVRSDQLDPSIAARMQTGSPTSLSQTVATSAAPFNLSFDYKFESTSGVLQVTINDVLIGTVSAPGTLSGAFQTATFLVNNPLLLGLANAILRFTLDGPTGSVMLLDNIVGLDLANGDFQVGNLSGWGISASGAGGVTLAVSEVPIPAALPLFASILGGAGFLAWRRKRKIAAALAA